MRTLRQFPALAILLLIASALMLVPALHAARVENWLIARTFLYHGAFFAGIGVILGLALANRRPRNATRYYLTTLLLAYVVLPVALAAPMAHLVPGLGMGGAYFEMLSSLTTTGATVFSAPRLLPDALHLWRALVGWAGGLMILVAAFAILAPLNLGGFEVGEREGGDLAGRRGGTVEETTARILRIARRIGPVYAVFTGLLALLLIAAGDRPFVAVCHAMATLSTSGISPVGGLGGARSGLIGEIAIALFFLAAVSHRFLSFDLRRARPALRDPQVRLMLISVLGVTLLLFLRSFAGASEIDRQDNLLAAARAVWGSLFTVLSFLTTTGFESRDWRTMQLWSNLPAPGIILLGVAIMGGGIATTAGGIKLLRLYALYRHGLREMDLLIHPSSVWARGQGDDLITARGARVAFVFLMLFLGSIAAVMILLAATGLAFEQSLALAVAGLTTTGPAIITLGDGLGYADLTAAARAVLCVAMIVGRIEALVLIALFNPAFWR
ncbi:MAG: TrkH family potassium uptake protein [Rhodobacteraceae bacterium]|nr:TrkH family potassium uptake protein [Paracoccaceae bacterium]